MASQETPTEDLTEKIDSKNLPQTGIVKALEAEKFTSEQIARMIDPTGTVITDHPAKLDDNFMADRSEEGRQRFYRESEI